RHPRRRTTPRPPASAPTRARGRYASTWSSATSAGELPSSSSTSPSDPRPPGSRPSGKGGGQRTEGHPVEDHRHGGEEAHPEEHVPALAESADQRAAHVELAEKVLDRPGDGEQGHRHAEQ